MIKNDLKSLTCSNCGTIMDISSFLHDDIEKIVNTNQKELENDFSVKLQKQTEEYQLLLNEKEQQIAEKSNKLKEFFGLKAENEQLKRTNQEAILNNKIQLENYFSAKLQKQTEEHQLLLNEKEYQVREKYIQQAEDKYSKSIQLKDQELAEKSNQLKELFGLQAENAQLKRTNQEVILNNRIQLENEFLLKFQKQAEENQLSLNKKDQEAKDLADKLTYDLNKQNQMSQQLQGEMQEEKVEDWLKKEFFIDTITPIKSGTKGADILQEVFKNKQNCGKICYEIKDAKDWKNDWIEKLQSDTIEQDANFGILVTNVFPKNKNKWYIEKNNIFVCSFEELKFLSFAVRFLIIKNKKDSILHENKEEKQLQLYNYLKSNKFKNQISLMVDYFKKQQNQLNQERIAINKIWVKREAQIKNVTNSVILINSDIDGILEPDETEILELTSLANNED